MKPETRVFFPSWSYSWKLVSISTDGLRMTFRPTWSCSIHQNLVVSHGYFLAYATPDLTDPWPTPDPIRF